MIDSGSCFLVVNVLLLILLFRNLTSKCNIDLLFLFCLLFTLLGNWSTDLTINLVLSTINFILGMWLCNWKS